MSLVTIPSYEGSLPFIYVYYAEEDTRLALPVLARLYNEGLRMWTRSGCKQPTDVRASQRISSCSALLIFLSENLDRDIHRELYEAMEALRCNKVKYFIRLSDMELPFDWGKSDANIVIDYARSNEAAFWLSIYDSEIIESCRGAWPKQPVKVGMSVFDTIDSGEISDEYSSILKIIGNSPALDRSGSPVSADDIALFAGAGESEEFEPPEASEDEEEIIETPVEDLNHKSMQDLFGMLDEISVSSRRKAEELQQSAEKRRQEQEEAALAKASLPFEQDAIKAVRTDEPPVPALSFIPSAMAVEEMAQEMFGAKMLEAIDEEVLRDILGDSPEEAVVEQPADDFEIVIIEDTAPETESKTEAEPSFEEFIDDLAGVTPTEEAAPVIEEEPSAVPEVEPETEEAPVPLPTHPITVEITEETESFLLPPATGSLTGFTLPDDPYVNAVYVAADEDDDMPTAAERAAAAEESRKQFESALEKAAYTVTGRIVARHSKGIHSMGLKVKKPQKKVLSIPARVKSPVKVAPTPVVRDPAPAEEPTDKTLSRAERRRRRKEAESASETPAERKTTVTPAPMRGEMPAQAITAPTVHNEIPKQFEAVTASDETTETTPSRRKKRHPHSSSGLLGILREMRSQKSTEEAESSSEGTAE